MVIINKIGKSKSKLLVVGSILLSVLTISFVQSASFEIDNQPEPTVSNTSVTPGTQDRGSSVVIISKAIDASGINYVKAQIKNGVGATVANVNLYDDGAHNDGAAGDDVYGNTWAIPATLAIGNYKIFITASDTLGNVYQTGVTTPFSDAGPRTEETNFDVTAPAGVCTDDCAIGEIGCMGLNNEWTCGEAGDGDACLDKVITACNVGKTCNVATGVCECANTCVSLGYECGTYTFCGILITCPPGCVAPNICNALGKCVPPAGASPTADARVGSVANPVGTSVTIDEDTDTVYFDGSTFSSDPDGAIVNYEWDFDGDGTYDWDNAATGATTHIYTIAGIYTAQLRVTDNDGMADTDTVVVTVNASAAPLTVSIDSPSDEDIFGKGDSITFDGLATGGVTPYIYLWASSIDGNIGNLQTFNKNDLSNGDHIITLTVTDSASATAVASIDIHIPPDSFDWRNVNGQNWMTSVKLQKFGDCWAFASLGSMEAKYNIEQNNSLDKDFSEEYLLDCWPLGGGSAVAFIQSTGVAEESCYPYVGSDSACPATCNDGSPINLWKADYSKIMPSPFNDKADLQ